MPAGHHSDSDSTLFPLPKSAITWFGGIFARLPPLAAGLAPAMLMSHYVPSLQTAEVRYTTRGRSRYPPWALRPYRMLCIHRALRSGDNVPRRSVGSTKWLQLAWQQSNGHLSLSPRRSLSRSVSRQTSALRTRF